jgi:hypothetical protein
LRPDDIGGCLGSAHAVKSLVLTVAVGWPLIATLS